MNKTLLLIFCIFFISCGNDKVQEIHYEQKNNISNTIPDYAVYGLESGVIQMESSVLGMKQHVTMYFDDWGRKLRNDVKMKIMGNETYISNIISGGISWQIDHQSGKVEKIKTDTIIGGLNYLTITKDTTNQSFSVKRLGETEVLGRKCIEYHVILPEQEIESTISVWKGIPLETRTKKSGFNVVMKAVVISENVVIPDSIFIVKEQTK